MGFNADPSASDRRDARNQSPSNPPGMGSDDIWGVKTPSPSTSNPFANSTPSPNPFGSSQGTSSPFGGSPGTSQGTASPFGSRPSPFGQSSSALPPSPFGARPMSPFGAQPPQRSYGDRAAEAAAQAGKVAAKQSWDFTKSVVESSHDNTSLSLSLYGVNTMKASAVVSGLGLALWVLSIFLPMFTVGYYLLLGGLLSLSWGIACFGIFYMKQSRNPQPQPAHDTPQDTNPFGAPQGIDTTDDDDGVDWDSLSSDDDWGDDEDDVDWDADEDDDDVPVVTAVNYAALNQSLETADLTPGVFTRDFIWETASKGLANLHPSFDKMESHQEGSDLWATIEEFVQDAAEALGTKEENFPVLVDCKESDFVFVITITRTPRLNVEALADELANIYKHDEFGNVEHVGCYATSTVFGSSAVITLYKGDEPPMVSLKDMMPQASSFVRNTNNFAPIILGSTAEGKVQYFDFIKATSLIVSGPPRTGKSWVVKLILNQLATYCSPKDVHFYIGDPKGTISDYIDYDMPHVRKRVFDPDQTVDMIRDLVYNVANKRRELMSSYGFKEIFEFRRKHPEVEFPFIYLILDEMVTLTANLSKEGRQEYNSLLNQLVSQLPALGIRAIFIPHRVKDQIIPKDVSELVPYRITVKATEEEKLANLGIKKASDFPYQLQFVGDLGVRVTELNQGNPTFVRAAVLAKDNSSMSDYEKYIRLMWSRLVPDMTAAPVTGSKGTSKALASYGKSIPTIDAEPSQSVGYSAPSVRDVQAVQPVPPSEGVQSAQSVQSVEGIDSAEDNDDDMFGTFDIDEDDFWSQMK